jgi:hypothetical protein
MVARGVGTIPVHQQPQDKHGVRDFILILVPEDPLLVLHLMGFLEITMEIIVPIIHGHFVFQLRLGRVFQQEADRFS